MGSGGSLAVPADAGPCDAAALLGRFKFSLSACEDNPAKRRKPQGVEDDLKFVHAECSDTVVLHQILVEEGGERALFEVARGLLIAKHPWHGISVVHEPLAATGTSFSPQE
eukprot:scaffold484360_cov50-Prasinocladus_malaysianus.AAC.1